MTPTEFSRILDSINILSPVRVRQLYHVLQNRMVAEAGQENAEETAFDVASRAGLIGCFNGAPRSPTDLSTSPKHMKGFGRG
jgi:hypothetical protein